MRLLFDYDIIIYRAGFAGQTTTYFLDGEEFASRKELNAYIGQAEFEDLDDIWGRVQQRTEMEPIENILHSVKLMIQEAVSNTGATEYCGYITGPGNFRYDLVDYYKANRKDKDKPLAYEQIVTYLCEHHNAEIVEGMEADDKLAIEQCSSNEPTCIATIDKDLDQIAGKHYNFVKKELYEVDEFQGMLYFYHQLLTGDGIDNIRGVPLIGDKKAAKILAGSTSELNAYRRCQQTYIDSHRKRAETLGLDLSEKELYKKAVNDLKENAALLWIVRELDDKGNIISWKPPVGEHDESE